MVAVSVTQILVTVLAIKGILTDLRQAFYLDLWQQTALFSILPWVFDLWFCQLNFWFGTSF